MTKIINWLFSRTKLFGWLDGHKRWLGFSMWLLGYVIEGLAYASGFFPEVQALNEVHTVLQQLRDSFSELLKGLGLTTMIVGVGHAAAKERGDA